jgi:hypothetical protein
MKLATVRQRIGAIRRAAKSGDAETAHRLEDALRADALSAIANLETDEPAALATLALSTTRFAFQRWCA